MAITLNGTTGISSPGGDTSTSLATTNLSYTGTLTGGTGVIAIGTNQIYKDASGNVGIGTASPSTYGKLAVLSSDNTEATVIQSLISNNTTAQLRLGFNRIVGYNTTAGNSSLDFGVTSYPQAVHIDSYGNLIVGGTSTSNKFEVYGDNIRSTARASSTAGMVQIEAQQSNYWTGPTYAGTSINQYGSAATGTTCGISNANLGALCFQNNSNALIWANGGIPIIFGTASIERARIDSSGNLIVGTTSTVSNSRFYVTANGNNPAARFYGSGLSDSQHVVYFDKPSTTNTTAQLFVGFTVNAQATGNGQINGNGAGAAAFGSFSDSRLKENIAPLPDQLANICALKPSEFDYKDGSGHQIGFIAQEMQEVYPDVVGEGEDGMLTITGWSKTEARLVKAIQELSAKVTALEAK